MQTIKISVEKISFGYEFVNDFRSVASITESGYGRYNLIIVGNPAGRVGSLPFAVEVVSGKLESIFGQLGIDVEFVTA